MKKNIRQFFKWCSKWFRDISVLKVAFNLFLSFQRYLEHDINSTEIITTFFISMGPCNRPLKSHHIWRDMEMGVSMLFQEILSIQSEERKIFGFTSMITSQHPWTYQFILSLGGINAILELMNSTVAAHGSRTEKAFNTAVRLSMKVPAVLSANATVNCNSSESYTIIFSLVATQENKH